jgi:hypothetical protein
MRWASGASMGGGPGGVAAARRGLCLGLVEGLWVGHWSVRLSLTLRGSVSLSLTLRGSINARGLWYAKVEFSASLSPSATLTDSCSDLPCGQTAH